MPRIYDEDRNPIDYCKSCFETVKLDASQNPNNDVDADHPDYDDTDYYCEVCLKSLTSRDN